MFGGSSSALCLVSAPQLSSSPSSSPSRWIQVAQWPGRKWRAGHLPFVPPSTAEHHTNLTNKLTHEPHHITDLNPSFNLQYLCYLFIPQCVRGQGHELQIWKHWKMDQMMIALCFTVSQNKVAPVDSGHITVGCWSSVPAAAPRRTFCQSLELESETGKIGNRALHCIPQLMSSAVTWRE